MGVNIDLSKDGYKIFHIDIDGKKQYIGSKYNQKKEIDKFIEQFKVFYENDNYIIFGLSFGEHVKELINNIGEKSKILIIELNKEVIQYFKNNIDSNEILKDKRICIANNISEMKSFFSEYIDELNISNIKIGFYCRYNKIYGTKLDEFYKVMRDETVRITTNRNTKLHFGEIWFDTLLYNLKYIINGTPINNLKDKYKNIPAVIVSAGPSLNKNVDKLKEKNNILIFSGGRTVRVLYDRNIKLDCLCVVDAGDVSYKLVENYINKIDCPLVFYEGTNSQVVKEHCGEKIFTSNDKFINNLFKDKIQSLSGGGSVSHSMAIMAAYMGCSPIIFIGQDLAYTDEKGHANCAENTWEKLSYNDYKNYDDIYINDIYGKKIRTSILLNRYRISLENIISTFSNVEFINATEGGANIKGAKNKTLESVLASLDKKEIKPLNKCVKKIDRSKEAIKELNDILNIFKEYTKIYFKRKDIIKGFKPDYDLVNNLSSDLKKIINSLNIIENLIFKLLYSLETSSEFLIKTSDSKEDKFRKKTNKDNQLFHEVKNIIDICEEKIQSSIQNLINIEDK